MKCSTKHCKLIKAIFKALAAVKHRVIVSADPSGITVKEQTEGIAVEARLAKTLFEEYTCAPQSFMVNANEITTLLKNTKNKDTLTLSTEDNVLSLVVGGRRRFSTSRLITHPAQPIDIILPSSNRSVAVPSSVLRRVQKDFMPMAGTVLMYLYENGMVVWCDNGVYSHSISLGDTTGHPVEQQLSRGILRRLSIIAGLGDVVFIGAAPMSFETPHVKIVL